ncbi:relaxase, partial [Pseudomonas savastanoi pv. glycinea str. race 4]
RLLAWPQRAREIKYVNKATPKFRKAYSEASPEDRVRLLVEREARFYQTYGESHDSVHTGQRQRDHQRSPAETTGRRTADLPMACKTCPSAMWQITGKPDRPEAVTVRCYCPVMHTFTWDSRNQEEILDCDHLYQEEDEEEGTGPQLSEEEEEAGLPPFLRKQREQQRQQALQADAGPELESPETPEYELDE